jgi:hypothetical protein
MGARAKDIDERIKAALKAGRAEELSTLRLAKAELSNKRVELKVPNTSDLDDDVVLDILRSMVKKREKAIELFEQGGRKDLADKERSEIGILQGLLPQELTGEALRSLVAAVIGEVGATTPRDMGKVMAALKGRPGVNASLASPIVKELLSPK